MKKPFIRLFVLPLLLFLFCSCSGVNAEETRIIIFDNQKPGECAFFSETFSYTEEINGRSREKKGYRVIRKKEDGSTDCPCIDPLCPHDVVSGCPLTSEYEIIKITVAGDRLFFRSETLDFSELTYYNLADGESETVFSHDLGMAMSDFKAGERYVWYSVPDVIDGKPVWTVNRYDPVRDKSVTLAVFDKQQYIYMLTDKRIYVGAELLVVPSPEDLNVVSFDYDGKNARKESPLLAGVGMCVGEFAFCSEFLATPGTVTMTKSGKIFVYNVRSREYHRFSENDLITCLGYSEKDGRILFCSYEKAAETYRLNAFSRALELGIPLDSFFGSSYELELLNEIKDSCNNCPVIFKSANPDGSDVRTLFELPAGGVPTPFSGFDPETFEEYDFSSNQRTGCLSDDGRWFYVETRSVDDDYRYRYDIRRIDVSTGTYESIKRTSGK